MELRINQAIKEHTKVSYAIESSGTLPFDVDCGEGINIVMAPPEAMKAFQNLKFEMLQQYPHTVSVKDSIITYWKGYADFDYRRMFWDMYRNLRNMKQMLKCTDVSMIRFY